MGGLTLLRAIAVAAGPPPCDVRPFKRSLARRPFSLWNDGQPYRTKRCPPIQDERADIADGAAHRGGVRHIAEGPALRISASSAAWTGPIRAAAAFPPERRPSPPVPPGTRRCAASRP